jgi:hypothetical protein
MTDHPKSHVLSGLIDKRAELAGKIEFTQTELRNLVIALDNLDATIRLFDPEIDLDDIKPKPLPARNQAFRGRTLEDRPLDAAEGRETASGVRPCPSRHGWPWAERCRQTASAGHDEARRSLPEELPRQGPRQIN